MKITFSQKTLNPNGEYPELFSVETRREYQSEAAVSAESAILFDRGNSRMNIVFVLERSHRSEADAEIFALSHAAELSASAPGVLSLDTGKKIYSAANAVPYKIKTETDSLITSTRYEFAATSLGEQQ